MAIAECALPVIGGRLVTKNPSDRLVAEPGADLKALMGELEHFEAFSHTIGKSHDGRLPITGVCITYL